MTCAKLLRRLAAAAMGVAFAATANAATIPGLFNTGVDAFGVVLGNGAVDNNYAISSGGNAVVVNQSNIPGTWLPNTSASRWVWQTATGQPVNVTRTFTTTFDLTGFMPATASITGRWATDNQGLDILINGVSTGQTAPGFTSWTNFSISTGFQTGVNTLAFVMKDVGVISGFRAEFLSSSVDPVAAVPVPAALPLLVTALGGLFALRRRARV